MSYSHAKLTDSEGSILGLPLMGWRAGFWRALVRTPRPHARKVLSPRGGSRLYVVANLRAAGHIRRLVAIVTALVVSQRQLGDSLRMDHFDG
jgi:hypothetical protein